MNTSLFFAALAFAMVAPALAITYLRPILTKVMRELCDSDSGAEFWIRCTFLLALSGSVLLMLVFNNFEEGASVMDAFRRLLMTVFASVFMTVTFISRNIWNQASQQRRDAAKIAAQSRVGMTSQP